MENTLLNQNVKTEKTENSLLTVWVPLLSYSTSPSPLRTGA